MKEFFKPGSVVLFQGDSVTDCGRTCREREDLADGYPQKVAAIYRALFPSCGVTFLNRGVSGNRTADLLARYEPDIRDLKPDFISVLIGINDVWRRYDSGDPTSAAQFEKNYRTLLERIKTDLPGTSVMLIEPFILHSLPDRERWHEDFDEKLQVVRRLAGVYADYFVPLDGILSALACTAYAPQALSEDGVHPTQQGHAHIAAAYLTALGVL